MSCGNPHQTPCTDVLHSLFLFIDGEIEDQQVSHAIEIHLSECPPCADEQAAEHRFRKLLSRSCTETAPKELRQRITSDLTAQSISWSQTITYTEISTDTFIQTHVEIRESYEQE
jgi:mycothiol system anti-sigma-R factor